MTLRYSICRFSAQAHDLTFDQIVAYSDACALYDLNKDPIQRHCKRRRQRLATHLDALQSSAFPPNYLPGPIRCKPDLVASVPMRDDMAKAGWVQSTERRCAFSDREIARFMYDQWVQHFDQARKRLEVFSHPNSRFYAIEGAFPGRSEEGVVAVHVSQILCDCFTSPVRADRDAAKTFRRNTKVIDWDKHAPHKAADFYEPEATYLR